MDDTWFKILVIIMSGLLIIILIIVVFVLYKMAKMMKTVKQITDQASNLVGRADHVANFFAKTAAPVAIVKLVSNIANEFMDRKGKKK